MSIIEAKNLKKYYGNVKAVDDISFTVEEGELFGFLGVNGAGKSTTINMLATLFPPTYGEVSVCGYSLGKDNDFIRRSIGIVWQQNALDDFLTIEENLLCRGYLYEKQASKNKQNLQKVTKLLNLEDVLHRRFGKLSGGQKRRCEIAAALMHTPRILFLDEPTTGLDPATRQNVWDAITKLQKEDGVTIFLTTHYMEEAAKSNHIVLLNGGKIVDCDTPFALKERYARDTLCLQTASPDKVIPILQRLSLSYREKEGKLLIPLHSTKNALPVLSQVEPWLEGFEVMQGTMDDVFLNACGKEL